MKNKQEMTMEKFNPFENMVKISAGSFIMGHEGKFSCASPLHKVTISRDFWIGKYPVTNGFYQAIMGKEEVPDEKRELPFTEFFISTSFFDRLNKLSAGKLPENYVFRLPTAAEWEYAARGGYQGKSTYFFDCPENSDEEKELEKYAWPLDGFAANIHPVGQKLPNGFGLYDMIGNTWEYCCDTDGILDNTPATDPVRVILHEHNVVRGMNCVFFGTDWDIRTYHAPGLRLVIAPWLDLTPKKTGDQLTAETVIKKARHKLEIFYPGRDAGKIIPNTDFPVEAEEITEFADKIIRENYPFEKAVHCFQNGMDLVSLSHIAFYAELACEAAEQWEKEKKEIAYIPLTPLGDVVCCINQLEHLKKIYAPCLITVFAIPLIAELLKNSAWVDNVVVLKGDVHGELDLNGFIPPATEFDVIFSLAYHPVYLELQDKLKCKVRYGSECSMITGEMCSTHFDKWVSQEYWNNVTLKKYRTVCEQMAEPIRLVDPDFNFVYPSLTPETYHLEPCPQKLPDKFVLFLPGTSWIGKYWPVTKYLAVAKTLKAAGTDAVFAIGPQDRRLVPALEKSGCPVLDTLPFAQLGYVINKAELVIGNDSGPMHFASAFHRKTIHIIATGSAFNWYPYEEPLHSLIMPDCACEEKCNACQKTCIGYVSVETVVRRMFAKIDLPLPRFREIAFMMQDRIGDSIVNIDALEEAAKIYAPCNITVFSPEVMKPFFDAYAFADRVIEFKGKDTELPDIKFDAVFNYRYDTASLELLRKVDYDTAYGYEQIDFPEAVCKEVFTKYLPLTLWDDVKLRHYSSVTEQGAALIRLVEPEYHCNAVSLAENTLCTDFATLNGLFDREAVLIVPGASSKYKDWGVENYLHLAADLKAKGKQPIFILGPQEKELYRKVVEDAGYKAAVNLPLVTVAALAFSCQHWGFAVGNDTGVMHLIRACNCRSITICFADAFHTWAPYARERHQVIHAQCADYKNCRMCRTGNCCKDMTYHQVWKAVAVLLNE